jgi:hypothetical protein
MALRVLSLFESRCTPLHLFKNVHIANDIWVVLVLMRYSCDTLFILLLCRDDTQEGFIDNIEVDKHCYVVKPVAAHCA